MKSLVNTYSSALCLWSVAYRTSIGIISHEDTYLFLYTGDG